MSKHILAIIIVLIFVCSISFALDLSGVLSSANKEVAESKNNKVTSAIYLDTVATFDVPDKWVYEGVILDEKYSQKKYTYIKNLDVSVLYGLRDLDQEIKKTMPFLSADSLLSTMSEQNFVDIIASASDSEVVEKMYGNNKFYEFTKTQQVTDRGKQIDVHSIIDMCIIDSNIFSFSYSYKDTKDAIKDYETMLTSFRLKNASNTQNTQNTESPKPVEEVKAPEVVTTPVEEPKVPEVVVQPTEEAKQPEEPKQEEVKEPEVEVKQEEVVNTQESEIAQELGEVSGNKVNEEVVDSVIEPIINQEITQTISENVEEPVDENTEIGVVIKRNEKKNFFQTILGVIASNPLLVCVLVGFVVLDIVLAIVNKNRKKKKAQEEKKAESTENIDKTEKK